MEQNIDLAQITDVMYLKALKSEFYDRIVDANQTITSANNDIQLLNQRILQLTQPQETGQEIGGSSTLEPVTLDVTEPTN